MKWKEVNKCQQMTKAKPNGPCQPPGGHRKNWNAEGPHPKRELLRARRRLIKGREAGGSRQKE